MDDTSPTGIKVPTQSAINALNKNAQAVANRSRLASQTQAQSAVGRDALRRDRVVRRPEASSMPNPVPVPGDATPTRQPGITGDLNNLLNQFNGTGLQGSGSGGGSRGGTSRGTPTAPVAPPSGGAYVSNGVQTFTGQGNGNQLAHVVDPQNSLDYWRGWESPSAKLFEYRMQNNLDPRTGQRRAGR